MKRVQLAKIGSYKDESNLHFETNAPIPEIENHELLVRVEACGVCFRDIIDREGGNSFVNPPISLGHEIAGQVIQSNSSSSFTDLLPTN
jgi:D-arabinose 1-dehydrogenase-like Zn-dependent alcohol dehydrogenase